MVDKATLSRDFHQRDAFLDGATGNGEEVLPIGFGEATIPFRQIGRDRQRRTVQLIHKKAVAVRKILSQTGNGVGKKRPLFDTPPVSRT